MATLAVSCDGATGAGWTDPSNVLSSNNSHATKVIGAESSDIELVATFSAGLFSAIQAGATITALRCKIEGQEFTDLEFGTVDLEAFMDGAYKASTEGATALTGADAVHTKTYSHALDVDDLSSGAFKIRCQFVASSADGSDLRIDWIGIEVDYTNPASGGIIGGGMAGVIS